MSNHIKRKLHKFNRDTGLAITNATSLFAVSRSTLQRWHSGRGTSRSWQWPAVEECIDRLNEINRQEGLYGKLVGRSQEERLSALYEALVQSAHLL